MKKHFNQHQRAKLSAMFDRVNEYKKHMNNLYKTREGLYTIMNTRSDLCEAVRPQFDTLNYLIDALLPIRQADFPFPPYRDVVKDISDPDFNGAWDIVICDN